MTSGRLKRLDRLWKTVHPSLLSQSISFCQLPTRDHGILQLCHKDCNTSISRQHYRYSSHSSHILKSPFKDLEISKKLIPEIIWETVDKFPEHTALKCGLTGRAYTFAELYQLSQRFANSLRHAGFAKGDVLSLILPNCPEFAIIVLGALDAEMTVSLINHIYTPDEMCHQLKDSGSVCVVSAIETLNVVLSSITKTENTTQSKPFRRIIAVDIPTSDSLPTGVSRYSEMVADAIDQSRNSTYNVQSNDVACLPYSSGTTGLSKGVCLSHRNIVSNIQQISSVDDLTINSPEKGQDIILGLLPFYHIYGLVVLLLNSLKNGGQVITLPKFEQDSFIHTMENEKLSVLMLVPPLILFIGAHSKITSKHLSNLRYIFSGAAPVGASDIEKVYKKIPHGNNCTLSQGYGMTELSPVATLPKMPCNNWATVGVPVSNSHAKIINPETGEALGPNESGELCFKGPQVMLGYHNNPKATSEMIDKDQWLRTGDIGYYDKDGLMYVQDRLKELIKVKGFQVPPAELEELLRTHPLVNDVGIIGVPCPRAGEVPVAYIVPKKDRKLTAEEIKDFLSGKVSRHKQVADVIFIDTIPKSAAGKILRKELREHYKNNYKQV